MTDHRAKLNGSDAEMKQHATNADAAGPVDIQVRAFNFAFPDDLDPAWIPGNPFRAHFFNGVSLTMPYLEPFLCKTMREALPVIDDPQLVKDMKGFIGQEAQHYQCHRRLNARLRSNGQPQFAVIEERIALAYQRLEQRSLAARLAYSAGFECMTNGFTNWLVRDRQQLFRHAQADVTSFWLAHMAEESEHKTVAFDVYQAVDGGYWRRAFGVLHGSLHVIGLGMIGMQSALRRDLPHSRWQRLRGTAGQVAQMLYKVGPYMWRALLPGYDPRQEPEPDWIAQWQQLCAQGGNDGPMPVIDTASEALAVPLAVQPTTS